MCFFSIAHFFPPADHYVFRVPRRRCCVYMYYLYINSVEQLDNTFEDIRNRHCAQRCGLLLITIFHCALWSSDFFRSCISAIKYIYEYSVIVITHILCDI